jgi:hypothetical protein
MPETAGLRDRILDFVASCRQPVLKEDGAEPLAITSQCFQLGAESDGLLLEAWDDRRTVSRRIFSVRASDARGIVLVSRRFGGRETEITISDTALRGKNLDRNLSRKDFRERFRALLGRQFPGATIEKLSTDRDLNRSFSEHYARAVLKQGQQTWAAIGCSEAEGASAAAAILTQGLLWLDHTRTTSLHLFVPAGAAATTAHRLAWLDPARAAYHLLPMPLSDGFSQAIEPLKPVDIANRGNLKTELRASRVTAAILPGARERLREIAAFPGVEEEITPRGELSLRYRGLEIAHADAMEVTFAEAPLAEIARIRNPDSTERRNPLYLRSAERWMESLLKKDLTPLSLDLVQSPVYSQILSEAGRTRGVMDLLAITAAGRLVVIELKADEDQNLALQALDYWMRVRWHLERGDFETSGFFPSRAISKQPPLLWLVFPSIRLHPANDIVLKYVLPQVPVARLGINEDWRKGIRVVFRA